MKIGWSYQGFELSGFDYIRKVTETSRYLFQTTCSHVTANYVQLFVENILKPYLAKVTGSNPVEVLTFSGFYTQLLKSRS